MDVWHHTLETSPVAGTHVLALGIFDGVHLGHRRLLENTLAQAHAKGFPCAVVTFDPHPAVVVAPGFRPRLLMTLEHRLRAFAEIGMDLAWVIPFSRDVSELDPEAFLTQLHRALGPSELHVGRAFRFGRDRLGDIETLKQWGQHASCEVHAHAFRSPLGGPLSSTRIREALDRGNAEEACILLGRPYALTGVVVEGDRRGRHLGFPTLNLAWEQEQLPAWGVYVTDVRCSHFKGCRLGLTNIGEKPTFEGLRLSVETHLPDFEGDLYGARVELGFRHRLRAEMKFPGIQELMDQVSCDVHQGRAWWKNQPAVSSVHRTSMIDPFATR